MEVDGCVAASVLAEHLELQGAGLLGPVRLDVPGNAVHLVGGEGDADLALRAVHPGLRDDPFRGVGEGPVHGGQYADGGVGVVGIDDFEVEIDDGFVGLPKGPGLGVRLNPDLFKLKRPGYRISKF